MSTVEGRRTRSPRKVWLSGFRFLLVDFDTSRGSYRVALYSPATNKEATILLKRARHGDEESKAKLYAEHMERSTSRRLDLLLALDGAGLNQKEALEVREYLLAVGVPNEDD